MIYNEWFRDENLEAPLMLGYKKTDDAAENTDPSAIKNQAANEPKQTTSTNEAELYSRKPAKAGKFHDYFTSCLPSPLKSDPVEINLTGNAMVTGYTDANYTDKTSIYTNSFYDGSANPGNTRDRLYAIAQDGSTGAAYINIGTDIS